MSWVLGLLALLFLGDTLKIRKRLLALSTLASPPADSPQAGGEASAAGKEPIVATRSGVAVDASTRSALAIHARAEQLDVVEVIPASLSSQLAILLALQSDFSTFRGARLAPGRSALHATWVTHDTWARATRGTGDAPGEDSVSGLQELAEELKRCAPVTTDYVVAPQLPSKPLRGRERAVLARALYGGSFGVAVGLQVVLYGLLIAGLLDPASRGLGLGVLALFHLQPALALMGTPLKPRDLPLVTLLRLPLELLWLAQTLRPPGGPTDQVEQRRPRYQRLVDEGATADLFESRSEACPICGGTELRVALRTTDLLQHKPGRFQIDACAGCGTHFQNPRLSLAGLDLYYGDFYDGLGGRQAEFVFGTARSAYRARAEIVRAVGHTPRRWLDVGGGHGHFACDARDVWPECAFDGLDISESIDDAARRGWVDRGHRGLFPERAADLAGEGYDVVSMSHYLEHTLDPVAELAAAATTLSAGGLLLIEVPDPASRLRRVLGRFWVPWFQPQHLNIVPYEKLVELLGEAGFDVEVTHRGECHQPVDLTGGLVFFLGWLAPPTNVPWRRRASVLSVARRYLVWTLGMPWLFLALIGDRVSAPAFRRAGWSNTYRVLARRRGPGGQK